MPDKPTRQGSPFAVSRREFFPALLQEIRVLAGLTKGGQAFQLSELGNLPDQELAEIVPMRNPAFEVYVDQGYLWSREKQTGRAFQEFAWQPENMVAFTLFDGEKTLGEIGERVATEMGWEKDKGFAHVIDLFLSMVSHLACVPRNPLVAA
jgi:hypothetical protein